MTINQMRCFSAVAKELNFAKAAKLLFISQPAVTHQIQLLENELGVQLFRRTSRTVSLTPAGVALFQDVDNILERIEQVSQRAIKAADSSVINVGCVSSLRLPQLPEIFRSFRQKEPGVMVNMVDVPHFDFKALIDSQLLDVVFTPSELVSRVPELNYLPIRTERLYCVVPENHRFAGREALTCGDLENETVIMIDNRNCPPLMDRAQQIIRTQAENILINYSSSSAYTIPMVQGGIGIGIMPGFVIPEARGLCRIPFELGDQTAAGFGYGLVYRKGPVPLAQRSFTETVKAFCQKGSYTIAGRK